MYNLPRIFQKLVRYYFFFVSRMSSTFHLFLRTEVFYNLHTSGNWQQFENCVVRIHFTNGSSEKCGLWLEIPFTIVLQKLLISRVKPTASENVDELHRCSVDGMQVVKFQAYANHNRIMWCNFLPKFLLSVFHALCRISGIPVDFTGVIQISPFTMMSVDWIALFWFKSGNRLGT